MTVEDAAIAVNVALAGAGAGAGAGPEPVGVNIAASLEDRHKYPAVHRQLFSRLENKFGTGSRPDDSSTEPDENSDDGVAQRQPHFKLSDPIKEQQQQQQQQDDLVGVGVSIGRAQTVMKSLNTPVEEKTRFLDEHDYTAFATAVDQQNDNDNEDEAGTKAGTESESEQPLNQALPVPVFEEHDGSGGAIVQEPEQLPPSSLPSSSKAGPISNQRSSASRAALAGISDSRQRSLSGSMLTGFKKVFQDLPSLPTFKVIPSVFASSKSENVVFSSSSSSSSPSSSGTALSPRTPLQQQHQEQQQQQQQQQQQPSERRESARDSTLQKPSSLLRPISPTISTHSRHRANSDSSLYLSRKPTGISTFDDIDVYASVSEQTNSRLKAITDALHNSSLRLPKLPSVISSHRAGENYEANGGILTSYLTRYNSTNNTPTQHANSPSNISKDDQQSQSTTLRSIRMAINKQHPTQHATQNTQQHRAHPILAEALSHTEGDIIVLGGYRGSVLRDAKPPHRQLWAPIKVGFNLRSVDLEVGLSKEDEERAREKVIPSGVLSHVGPIDICRRLLKHMKKCPNAREGKLRVHDWGYDWRLSPDLLSRQLISFLEGLECNNTATNHDSSSSKNNKNNNNPTPGDNPGQKQRQRGAWVIAHSLGGLITRYAVNQRPDLFAGVVYAGVPQHCVNILGPLRNGDDVLLSSRVLTAQVNFTLRTSFALLPEGGRCFFQKDTRERYDVDFFNPKSWEEYRLSPCISPPLPVPPSAALPQPWWQQPRKSIIDSMGSLSDALPSLPKPNVVGKRLSWFGAGPQDQPVATATTPNTPTFFNRPNYNGPTQDATPSSASASASASALALASATTLKDSPSPSPFSSLFTSTSTSTSVATTVTIPPAAARVYLKRTLAEVLAFKRALAHREDLQRDNKYPPHAIIFGKTVPTVYGARVASREAIKYTSAYDNLAFAAGDGVVLASAAQLPDGYRCVKGGRIETDRGHVGLLGDLEAVGKCIAAVVQARHKGVGAGNDT